MSDILLKSKIDYFYRGLWIWIPLMWSPLIIGVPIIYFYQLISSYMETQLLITLRTFTIIFLIIFIFLIWIGLQFHGSYLILFSNGIKIKKPFGFFKYRFISWNSIKELKIVKIGRSRIRFDYKEREAIHIFLENENKPIIISGIWVEETRSVYNLMNKYIEHN